MLGELQRTNGVCQFAVFLREFVKTISIPNAAFVAKSRRVGKFQSHFICAFLAIGADNVTLTRLMHVQPAIAGRLDFTKNGDNVGLRRRFRRDSILTQKLARF